MEIVIQLAFQTILRQEVPSLHFDKAYTTYLRQRRVSEGKKERREEERKEKKRIEKKKDF